MLTETINQWLIPIGGLAGAYFLGSLITRAFIYNRIIKLLDRIEANTREKE